MENLKKKSESVEKTTDVSNQSPTVTHIVERLVDKLQSSSSLDDRCETNAVDEHHHHESLDTEKLENSSSSKLQLNNSNEDDLNEDYLLGIYPYLFIDNMMQIRDRFETNAVDEYLHHHHESLDTEWLENLSSSELQLNNSNKDYLNEDCLLEIFSYLSIDDMIQVERVCKKWYEASQQWFKRIQTLVYIDGRKSRLELYEKYYKRKIYEKTAYYRTFNDFISILRSCGHYIKYYEVNIIFRDTNPIQKREKFLFQWIPKFCENIVDVKIYGIGGFLTLSNFEVMATHWKKLVKINIDHLLQPAEDNFYNLLRNNKQLKTLTLLFPVNFCLMNYEFFTYLPITMTEICIENMIINDKKQFSHFISASKNFTSLKSLELSRFRCLTDAVVSAIANITSLTHLSLKYVNRYESRKTINQIANLQSLKSLILAHNSDLYDDNVINIVESCIQLELLIIHMRDGGRLMDKGIAAIAKLKRLKYLYINMENVTVESIINLRGSLEVLRCWHWKINNSDAINLLKNLMNLRLLDFELCNNITRDVLVAANKIANDRKNNILCITAPACDLLNAVNIDTPYFKFVNFDYRIKNIPLEIFPENMRYYITKTFEDC